MDEKKVKVDFPKYNLIVDDTGDDRNNKYHVGFLTPKMTTSDFNLTYEKLKFFKESTLEKINLVINLANSVLESCGEDFSKNKIKNIKEIHAIDITPLIKDYTKGLEKKKILPYTNDSENIFMTISKNSDFAKFIEICKNNQVLTDEMFTGDNNQTVYDILNLTKFLIGDYFFDYAKNISKFIASHNLKIITSEPSVDDKLLEGSELTATKNCSENKKQEVLSYKNLCLNALNYISSNDNTSQIHLNVLCDNGIRKNISNLHIYNHKEFNPFSIQKITGEFQDSKENCLLECADIVAWMNNRFEKAIVKKVAEQKELKYLDKKVLNLFMEYLLPNMIESDYTRLANVFTENQIQRSTFDLNDRKYVERIIDSSLENEPSI